MTPLYQAIENVNTPLALRLIPLAQELEDFSLVERLLEHAKKVSEDDLESGWVEFEKLKNLYSIVKSRPSFKKILADRIIGVNPHSNYLKFDY